MFLEGGLCSWTKVNDEGIRLSLIGNAQSAIREQAYVYIITSELLRAHGLLFKTNRLQTFLLAHGDVCQTRTLFPFYVASSRV